MSANVLVHCPQNSGCSLFTLHLCWLLDAACQPDLPPCAPSVSNQLVSEACLPCTSLGSWVMKATVVADRFDVFRTHRHRFARRILFLNDPVKKMQTIMKKHWREDCGGLRAKQQQVDELFAHRQAEYDATIYQEDAANWTLLSSHLRRLGLLSPAVQARSHRPISIAAIATRTAAVLNFSTPTFAFEKFFVQVQDGLSRQTYPLRLGNTRYNFTEPEQQPLPPYEALVSSMFRNSAGRPPEDAVVCAVAAWEPHLTARYHGTGRCGPESQAPTCSEGGCQKATGSFGVPGVVASSAHPDISLMDD